MAPPVTVDDTVLYTLKKFYGDKDITVRMLDGSVLDIWGPVYVNGALIVDTAIGIPIASQAEALAGTDNTKVMTPLRVREAGDSLYMPLGTGISQAAADTRYVNTTGDTMTGLLTVNPQITIGNNTGSSALSLRSFNAPNYITFTRNSVDSWYIYDANSIILYFRDMVNARMALSLIPGTATTMRLDVGGRIRYASDIPDNPYSAAWNGSFDLPTKNEVYDKIEAIISSDFTQALADARYVNITGDVMTGDLDVRSVYATTIVQAPNFTADQQVTALALAPISAFHLTRKDYVDNRAATRPHLYLPGTTGNYISTPDPPQLAGATQLDIRWIEKAPPNGALGYLGGVLSGQGSGAAATTCSFLITSLANQAYGNFFIADGTTIAGPVQLIVRPTAGTAAARFTWRASDGRVQAFTKQTADVSQMLDNTGWTQIGGNQTMAIAALGNIAGPLTINSYAAGTVPGNQNLLAYSIATTIDSTPFALWRSDTTSNPYLDDYSTSWTINGIDWEWRDNNGLQIGGPQQDAIKIAPYATRPYLNLPGAAGSTLMSLELPDPPQLAGATELDVRWIERGRPSYTGTRYRISHANSASQLAFTVFTIDADDAPDFRMSLTGSPANSTKAAAGFLPANDVESTMRVTWRGSDGRVQWFKKASADPTLMLRNDGWVQHGATAIVPQFVGAMYNAVAPLTVSGIAYTHNSAADMQIGAVSIATTIDGVPFATWRADAMLTNYTDSVGATWSITGQGWHWVDSDGGFISGPQSNETLYGTSFPEGIITAPVGRRYIDTAATNGAVEWIKASGIGNTGWRVVYGDTGWRNIDALALSPWATSWPGNNLIRRVGDRIELLVGLLRPGGGSGAEDCFTLPVGFCPHRSQSYASAHGSPNGVAIQVSGRVASTGAVNAPNWCFTYLATPDWPAALPGTAA